MTTRLAILSLALTTVFSLQVAWAQEVKEVQVGGIKLSVPPSWKQSQPTSNLRLAQFEIPAAAGEQPGELAIFAFGGTAGGVQANLKRWIDQFQPEGRQVKITKGKAAAGEYVFAEISGTYNRPVGPPVLGRTEPMPNAKTLGVILRPGGESDYFLKLTGGKQTASDAAAAFRASFGGNAAEEQPFELE